MLGMTACTCRLAAGVHARAQADPAFLLKLGCGCGADALIIAAVNRACRGARFWPDLDAVLSQVQHSVIKSHVHTLSPSLLATALDVHVLLTSPESIWERFQIQCQQFTHAALMRRCVGAVLCFGAVRLRAHVPGGSHCSSAGERPLPCLWRCCPRPCLPSRRPRPASVGGWTPRNPAK